MECGKYNTKKVNHNHIVVAERFRANVLYRSKVLESSSNLFKHNRPIFNCDIFVTVFIFWSFQMLELVNILELKFVGKYPNNFGLSKTRIFTSNKECSRRYPIYDFLLVNLVSMGSGSNGPRLYDSNFGMVFLIFADFINLNSSLICFNLLLLKSKHSIKLFLCESILRIPRIY